MPNTVAQNLVRLQASRTAIAEAITDKGGTVNSGDGFEEFANDIATIPTGGSSSITEALKSPKTFNIDKFSYWWQWKTWFGETNKFEGENVWTDGTNIYYSYSTTQYVLLKSLVSIPTTKCIPAYE